MPFTLHVTFAGLCLFRRNPTDRLVVLIPDTPPSHRHEAVLGFHVRYEEQTGQPGRRFHEINLRDRVLDLSSLSTGDTFDISFPQALADAGVVDISHVVERPAKNDRAVARVEIAHGTVCPANVCATPSGALWHLCRDEGGTTLCDEEPTFMATSVQWIISNVTEQVRGSEGLELKTKERRTGNVITHATLRPDDEDRIRIYVFHSPANELPSSPGAPRKRLKHGDRADHFREFKRLFDRPAREPVPRFHAYRRADQQLVDLRFLGRLFTCMVASADGE